MTPEEVDAYLAGRRTMNVATIGPSGHPHVVAMWYGFHGGAPAFWTALGGDQNAGKGVKFADLDTGVDFSNPMFTDPSLPMPASRSPH